MVTTIMKWVCMTASLLVVLLRPSASHQLALDLLACAGAFMIVLALLFNTRDRDLSTALRTDRSQGSTSLRL
jgi:hypothetical protein